MDLISLYKKHINPNMTGLEIHNLYQAFDLGIYIPNPNLELRAIEQKYRLAKKEEAKLWILKNSKLTNII